MDENQHRIAFAYFLDSWKFGTDLKEYLKLHGEKITPEEYRPEMKNTIFCPECTTPLSRTPEEGEIFSNKRTAHYRHRGKYKDIYCSLRVSRKSGLQYQSEEEVRKAVQDENLVLIGGWAAMPPDIQDAGDLEDLEFRQTQVEDPDGPLTEIPLGRHTGKKVSMPTKISSVLSICRNFDKNIHRAFYFPDSQYAMHLRSVLYDVNRLEDGELPERPNLFFGKIVGYRKLSARHIIYLEAQGFPELKIYTWPTFDERKKIDSKSIGRMLLCYGGISSKSEGIPRCMTDSWGQYSYCLHNMRSSFRLNYKSNFLAISSALR